MGVTSLGHARFDRKRLDRAAFANDWRASEDKILICSGLQRGSRAQPTKGREKPRVMA